MKGGPDFILESTIAFLQIYIVLILLRMSLGWFPNINWYSQPFYSLSQLSDPYLNLFHGIFPSFLGIDFSPVIGITLIDLVIELLSKQVRPL
nr:hypothetical protein [Cyanidiaceae sp.]